MKDKIFGVLQRVGRSFMLPIALLPVAGLLLGIGSSFTNETMLAAYGLNSVIHPGTLIYTILDVMSQTGSAVFNNLALLFAMGVAIGMATLAMSQVPAYGPQIRTVIRRSGLYHYEYSHSGHDQCGRRRRSDACQLHYHHAGYHNPANGCVRRHRGRSGRGGAAQQVL